MLFNSCNIQRKFMLLYFVNNIAIFLIQHMKVLGIFIFFLNRFPTNKNMMRSPKISFEKKIERIQQCRIFSPSP